MPANCVVVPAGTDALVGQVVMKQLDLVADCATQTLGPRPESEPSSVEACDETRTHNPLHATPP